MQSYGHGVYQSYANAAQDDPSRGISRTPSPSPSEITALNQTSVFDIRTYIHRDKLFSKKYLMYYAIGILVIVISLLFLIYDKQIVHALQPAANWMHSLKFGWLIPIAIFFVISFPPLFGHEILAIVVGLVWGVGVGFAITAAGTFLGEVANFYATKYFFQSYATRKEKSNIQYACIAKLVREGGFKIALILRYSAVPGHFTTAVFSLCGMKVFIFIAAAILSLPKQFITVYIGTLLEEEADGSVTTTDKVLSYVVGTITGIVTIAAMWYIQRGVNRVKPDVIYARRKARQAKLGGSSGFYQNAAAAGTSDDTIFNPAASETVLTTSDMPYDPPYQKWDKQGHAVGYSSDPRVYAPQPRRVAGALNGDIMQRGESATPTGRENTDSVGWELPPSERQSYPLQTLSVPEPVGPLRNPFETDEALESALPANTPSSDPHRGMADGGYAFSAPHHSFGTNASKPGVKSPPPFRE
ncbi:hypothetical protein ID866_4512 [Astraeus odoratus]|nr:hypothetical protein ID866_4512 [Astraeus odoratus]